MRSNLLTLNFSTPSLNSKPSLPNLTSKSSLPNLTSSTNLTSTSTSTLNTSSTTLTTPISPPPTPIAKIILEAWRKYNWHNSSDALTAWLNARWKKSGYSVDARYVFFLLRMNGFMDVRMGTGDHRGGGFVRSFCEEGDGDVGGDVDC